jgi:protein subunit release factor B
VDTFRAGGKGGQHQNKTETGVRVVHAPSGAIGEARDTRSQLENKRSAFRRMAESKAFRLWARMEAARLSGQKSVDELVDEAMEPRNLRIEVRDDEGKWRPFAEVSPADPEGQEQERR